MDSGSLRPRASGMVVCALAAMVLADPSTAQPIAPDEVFAQINSNTIGRFNSSGVQTGTMTTFGSGVITDLTLTYAGSGIALMATNSGGAEFFDTNGAFLGAFFGSGIRNTAWRNNVIYAVRSNGAIVTFPPQSADTVPIGTPGQALWFDLDGINPCILLYTVGGQRVRRYNLCTHQPMTDLGTLPSGTARAVRSFPETGNCAVVAGTVIYVVDNAGRVLRQITNSSVGETGAFAGLHVFPLLHSFMTAGSTGNAREISWAGTLVDNTVTGFVGLSAAASYRTGGPSRIPLFDHSCGSQHDIPVGLRLSFDISVHVEPGETLTVEDLPPGAILTPPLPLGPGDVTTRLEWIPAPGDVGSHRVIFSVGNGTTVRGSCAYDIVVGPPVAAVDTPRWRGLELGAARPTPANGEVSIRFRLAIEQQARFTIVDLQGRERAVVEEGRYPAGEHDIVWDGRLAGEPAATGIYFLRCRSGPVTLVRKLVVSR